MAIKRECCFMGCESAATWQAYSTDGRPDEGTDACDDHLGHLLTDAPTHYVYPIPFAG